MSTCTAQRLSHALADRMHTSALAVPRRGVWLVGVIGCGPLPVYARPVKSAEPTEGRSKVRSLGTALEAAAPDPGCSGWAVRTPCFREGLNPGLAPLFPTLTLAGVVGLIVRRMVPEETSGPLFRPEAHETKADAYGS